MGGGSSEQTIGYKYYLGMHLILCHGPVNSINRVYVGERLAYPTPVNYDGVNSSVAIGFNAPTLFGGEKKEGGVSGTVDILFGASDQGTNDYLSAQGLFPLPAFRGVVSAVLNQCYVCANNPYPKTWWFEITRIPGSTYIDEWYPEKAEPTTGSANAAHMIRELLINPDWGLDYPVTAIDNTSFQVVADTLYDEEFGLSMILSGQDSVESLIQEILRTVNGALYTDRETGKFTLKLIRDDYIVGELQQFDENNILEYSSFQRPVPAEMVNEVSIIYRRKEDVNDTTVTFQDLASVISQGAIISQTLNFPGIDDDNIASKVGMREIRQYSTPLLPVTFTANRDAWNLNPGDPFIFTWLEKGVAQVIMRAVKIDYGNLSDGRIEITAIEDIFGLPESTYIQPQASLWEDPVVAPSSLQPEDVSKFEIPYYILATRFSTADFNTILEDSSFLIVMASFPSFASPSFELWTTTVPLPAISDYTFKTIGTYCYKLTLNQDLLETDNEVDIDIGAFPANFEEDVPFNSLCFIGNEADESTSEIAIYSSANFSANTIQLKRGALDTLPKAHNSSTAIWFFDNNWAFDPTEYTDGNQVTFRPLPQTGVGTLGIGSASFEVVNLEGRQYKPMAPSYIRIQDSFVDRFYPASIRGDTIISWLRTNRITQTVANDAPYFYSTDDVVAENGIVWRLLLFDETLPVSPTITVDNPSTTTSYTWSTEEVDSGLSGRLNNRFRVILQSIRIEDSIEIESKDSFDLIVDRRGWNYNFNLYWDGEE